ncbi:MAG: hypothetical protein JRI45_06580, partial [Deltaproteobacteria bacterium]|nr:hypothetical protein [Deltaproteobacteria bacterium]
MRNNWRKITQKILNDESLTREDEEWAVKKIQDYWDNHPDVTNRYPRWKKYIAWVAGYQIFDYNKISKKLVEVPLARKRKIIFNQLKGFVRVLLAKLSAEPHTPGVVPATNDHDDIEAAKVGDRYIAGHSETIDFTDTTTKLKLWTIVCNKAYLRVLWNTDMEGIIDLQRVEEKDPITGEVIGESFKAITEEGDLDMECISPFNCRPDPLYSDHDKWRWFVYGEEVDAEELEEEYGLKPGSLVEQSNTLDTAYDLELQDEQDIIVGSPDKSEDITGRTVVQKQFWTKDIYIFTAGTKVLEYGPNKDGVIPFFPTEERLIPIDQYEKGFSFNESLIKDAIPIQREYNRQASVISTALERAAKLKIMVPMGSMLRKEQWTNDYGVFYNPHMGNPYQMKIDPFPVELPQYKSSLIQEMQSVMNLHPASFGQLPERASHPSGSLVNLLLEQDDIVLNPLLSAINRAIGKAWSLGLRIVRDNYVTSRL